MAGRKRSTVIKRGIPSDAHHQLRSRSHAAGLPADLPLVHVTPVGNVRRIVGTRKLETQFCPVFDKKLLYFFVLRPAYRFRDGDQKSHQINRFPVVFILKDRAVDCPYHVYPFDTGGADAGIFDEQADPFVRLEDYELEPNMAAARGHIGWAFGTLQAYLDGDLAHDILDDVPVHETVTRSFVDIAKLARSGSNQPDKRASSVEVAVDQNVDLVGNVLLAILPKQYLEEAGPTPNTTFIQMLKQVSIPWKVYDWQPNKTPSEFQDEIARIARAFYAEKLELAL